MSDKWPRTPLGEVLAPISRPEKVNTSTTYRLLGARWYAGGLYIKDICDGTQIRADKVYKVERGDFVYNRLFAWKGSFAVADDAVHGCYVSNEFPCFRPNPDKIELQYLRRYMSRETAWNEALGLSSGGTPTSRNRLKEEKLLGMAIPIPPIEEQRRIVARIEALTTNVAKAEIAASMIEKESQGLLMAIYNRLADEAIRRRLGDVAPLSRRPAVIDPAQEYPRVSVRSFGRGSFHNPPLRGSEITWEKPHLVRAGDILVSNIKAWEGAIAVARREDDGRYGSHRYLTYVPVPGVATARWICFHLLSPEGLHHVGEASPGSADRNRTTSAKALLEIPVPVPSYDQQVWFEKVFDRVQLIRQLQTETAKGRDALTPAILHLAFAGSL